MPEGGLKIRFLRLPGAENLPLPTYQTKGASGLDVCAAVKEPKVLSPGEIALIPLGLSCAIPEGYELQVRPRSGLAARHGISLVNAPGTIDADYRGEISIILINLGRESFTITRGMRIAQLVAQKVEKAEIVLVDSAEELGETDRGQGGFGHTGTR